MTTKKKNAKPRRGGLTIAKVAEEIATNNGNLAAVGRVLGVSRQAVSKFVAAHEELQEVCKSNKEELIDNAEKSLHSAIEAGEAWAICFFLKTQAKHRGYVERTEHKHGGSIGVEVVEPIVRTRAEAKAILPYISQAS